LIGSSASPEIVANVNSSPTTTTSHLDGVTGTGTKTATEIATKIAIGEDHLHAGTTGPTEDPMTAVLDASDAADADTCLATARTTTSPIAVAKIVDKTIGLTEILGLTETRRREAVRLSEMPDRRCLETSSRTSTRRIQ